MRTACSSPRPPAAATAARLREHPVRLRVDAFGHLHARRIHADLAGHVDGGARLISHSDALRIGSDRFGRVARLDGALHGGYLSVVISSLEKLLGTPRDGALLRYSLGLEYAKAGEREKAIEFLREAVTRDPLYSAAWKALGRELAQAHRVEEALEAYRKGIDAAKAKGDRQAEKEMTVFARR